jgi:hypothetical protein
MNMIGGDITGNARIPAPVSRFSLPMSKAAKN